jgi:hypothetical protein
LPDHHGEDRKNKKRREVPRGVVKEIEKAAHLISVREGHILR